jgi:hypothetical protein
MINRDMINIINNEPEGNRMSDNEEIHIDRNRFYKRNELTLSSVNQVITVITESILSSDVEDLIQWIPEMEDLLSRVQDLLEKARFYAWLQVESENSIDPNEGEL